MLGMPVKPHPIALVDIDYVAVKAPQFSFTRLQGADPVTGVEMASTGEVACFGDDIYEAYLKAIKATGFKMPDKTRNILLSIGTDDLKREFLDSVVALAKMKYNLFATEGTAEFYKGHGIDVTFLHKPSTKKEPNAHEYITSLNIDLVICISDVGASLDTISDGYLIRRAAVDFGVSLLTNIKTSTLFVGALAKKTELKVKTIDQMYAMGVMGWSSGVPATQTANPSGKARSFSISA
jgi:carbamoyl-phosphate synthase/aspartate carbamoyltransferase